MNDAIKEGLRILDTHYGYLKQYEASNSPHKHDQEAYYDGLFTMLEVIISEGFTNHKMLFVEQGKHVIREV